MANEEDDLKLNLEKDEDDGQKTELSAAEERASKSGWTPLEDWGGAEEDWVDASTFNERGKFIGQIRAVEGKYSDAQREIETLKRMMEQQAKVAANASEREYKRAVADLKREKSEAMSDMEFEKVQDLDDRIDELKEAKRKDDTVVGNTIPGATPVVPATPAQPQLTQTQQEVLAWMKSQDFLKEKDVMGTFAEAADAAVNANPNLSAAEVIETARVHTFNRYTHLGNQQSNRSSVNDSGNRRTKGNRTGNKFGPGDLSAQERKIMDAFRPEGQSLQAQIDEYAKDEALEIQNQ